MEDYSFFENTDNIKENEYSIINNKYNYYDENYESYNDTKIEFTSKLNTCNNIIDCCNFSTIYVIFVYWFSL